LADLQVLSKSPEKKFSFGLRLYSLGRIVSDGSDLIRTAHPYLVRINRKTGLSTYLGIRAGSNAVIVDKVDSDLEMKISMKAGLEIPLIVGAGGKALLSLLPDAEIDRILSEYPLETFAPFTRENETQFKEKVDKVRSDGFALDDEEYMEGICALAVPLNLGKRKTQAAIWTVGLKSQFKRNSVENDVIVLKETAESLVIKLSLP
jgi:IclR family KDG regulon transcriptional repressor